MNYTFIGFISTIAAVLSYGTITQAASVTTTGIWSDVEITNSATLTGIGTHKISWGTPTLPLLGQKSSYVFQGVKNNSLTLPPAGGTSSMFALGTFTHNNFPILSPSITGATLKLALNINSSTNFTQTFSFNFAHEETPNTQNHNGTCNSPSGYKAPCPDIVSFLNNGLSKETVTINGEKFNLIIGGFKTKTDGPLVNQFITLEDKSNSATLYGYLGKEKPADAVPEPLTIIGVGTALGFGTLFKKQQSKNRQKN